MSNRSIVEFNHDYASTINARSADEFVPLLMRALSSGSDREWEPLKKFGIRRVIMAHHSDTRKVVVNKREYEIG